MRKRLLYTNKVALIARKAIPDDVGATLDKKILPVVVQHVYDDIAKHLTRRLHPVTEQTAEGAKQSYAKTFWHDAVWRAYGVKWT